jgi:hypothetical protein
MGFATAGWPFLSSLPDVSKENPLSVKISQPEPCFNIFS